MPSHHIRQRDNQDLHYAGGSNGGDFWLPRSLHSINILALVYVGMGWLLNGLEEFSR